MSKKQYQAKYAEAKRKLHTCVGGYGSSEYNALKALMNYYYAKGFCS